MGSNVLRGIRLGYSCALFFLSEEGSCAIELTDPGWETQSSDKESSQACSIAATPERLRSLENDQFAVMRMSNRGRG